jgi:hypothetical protein
VTEQQPETDIPQVGPRDGSSTEEAWEQAGPHDGDMPQAASGAAYNGGRAWVGPDEDDDTTYLTQRR